MAGAGRLAIKVQLFAGDEPVLGPGRADVLAAIDREGSIVAAGRSLGMSYKFTWDLVTSMNRCFRDKLVEASAGGSRGGGARLTELGQQVLAAYRTLQQQVAAGAEGEPLATLIGALR